MIESPKWQTIRKEFLYLTREETVVGLSTKHKISFSEVPSGRNRILMTCRSMAARQTLARKGDQLTVGRNDSLIFNYWHL
jgi:hypothetical protein